MVKRAWKSFPKFGIQTEGHESFEGSTQKNAVLSMSKTRQFEMKFTAQTTKIAGRSSGNFYLTKLEIEKIKWFKLIKKILFLKNSIP